MQNMTDLWPQVTGAASIQRGFCVCAQFPRLSGLARVSWASQEHSLPVVRADEAMDTSDIWQSGQRGGGLLWNRWRITLHWYIHDIHGCWFFRVYAYIYNHAISVNVFSGNSFYQLGHAVPARLWNLPSYFQIRSCKKVRSSEPWRKLPHPVRKWKQLMDRSCKLAIWRIAMLPGRVDISFPPWILGSWWDRELWHILNV